MSKKELIEAIISLGEAGGIGVILKARAALYPEANIVSGMLSCSSCQTLGEPTLRECGYIIDHDLRELSPDTITASGWGGTSSDVSEEGELYILECQSCFQWHRLPKDMVVEWV